MAAQRRLRLRRHRQRDRHLVPVLPDHPVGYLRELPPVGGCPGQDGLQRRREGYPSAPDALAQPHRRRDHGYHINFLKTAINEIREYNGLEQMAAKDFLAMVKEKQKLVELDGKLTNRSVNEGFSGGEKKRNEIFQLAMLEPKLAILDETDSGLDIDALKIVANGVNMLKNKNNAFIVITHYQRLLDYIIPDFVHVLYNGKIVKSGTKEMALELEAKGYDEVKKEFDFKK